MDASSCGASVSATEAYINAPSDIASFASCSFTIEKASSNICQYRLDFDAFELAAPASVSAAGGYILVLGVHYTVCTARYENLTPLFKTTVIVINLNVQWKVTDFNYTSSEGVR